MSGRRGLVRESIGFSCNAIFILPRAPMGPLCSQGYGLGQWVFSRRPQGGVPGMEPLSGVRPLRPGWARRVTRNEGPLTGLNFALGVLFGLPSHGRMLREPRH